MEIRWVTYLLIAVVEVLDSSCFRRETRGNFKLKLSKIK
jgi:hypothetical protein